MCVVVNGMFGVEQRFLSFLFKAILLFFLTIYKIVRSPCQMLD